MLEILEERNQLICSHIIELLDKHSKIERWNDNSNNNGVVFLTGDYRFKELDIHGSQLQNKIFKEFQKHFEIVKLFFVDLAVDVQKQLAAQEVSILIAINQNKLLWHGSMQNIKDSVSEAFGSIKNLLNRIHSCSDDQIIFVPDTNALLINPDIETWAFDDVKAFEIILCPTVLSELDNQKTNHRNEVVRNKADKIIKKIKEYRRRGALAEGVTIVNNSISLRTISEEPNMSQTVSWFVPDSNDDKILTSFIGLMRANSKSKVILVTSDINLQNKADTLGFPYSEPPSQS